MTIASVLTITNDTTTVAVCMMLMTPTTTHCDYHVQAVSTFAAVSELVCSCVPS